MRPNSACRAATHGSTKYRGTTNTMRTSRSEKYWNGSPSSIGLHLDMVREQCQRRLRLEQPRVDLAEATIGVQRGDLGVLGGRQVTTAERVHVAGRGVVRDHLQDGVLDTASQH